MTPTSNLPRLRASFHDIVPQLPSLADAALGQVLQHALDHKTKPLGSLGRLEALARQLGEILGQQQLRLVQPQLLLFAADHGLACRGVSAYPSDVTWQMVENFLAGGAAVSVLARQHGINLPLIDCGVAHDFASRPPAVPGLPQLLVRKIARATADSSERPAMTLAQCLQAIANGREVVRSLPGNVVLMGEMGIGNTSAAAMLFSRLAGRDIADCTGAGTGLDARAVVGKTALLAQVLERHANAVEPIAALAALGGFEIATMVGALLQAALERRMVLVDGFIVGAAVLVAHALEPALLQRCVFAHCSGERGPCGDVAASECAAAIGPAAGAGRGLGRGAGMAFAAVSLSAVVRNGQFRVCRSRIVESRTGGMSMHAHRAAS